MDGADARRERSRADPLLCREDRRREGLRPAHHGPDRARRRGFRAALRRAVRERRAVLSGRARPARPGSARVRRQGGAEQRRSPGRPAPRDRRADAAHRGRSRAGARRVRRDLRARPVRHPAPRAPARPVHRAAREVAAVAGGDGLPRRGPPCARGSWRRSPARRRRRRRPQTSRSRPASARSGGSSTITSSAARRTGCQTSPATPPISRSRRRSAARPPSQSPPTLRPESGRPGEARRGSGRAASAHRRGGLADPWRWVVGLSGKDRIFRLNYDFDKYRFILLYRITWGIGRFTPTHRKGTMRQTGDTGTRHQPGDATLALLADDGMLAVLAELRRGPARPREIESQRPGDHAAHRPASPANARRAWVCERDERGRRRPRLRRGAGILARRPRPRLAVTRRRRGPARAPYALTELGRERLPKVVEAAARWERKWCPPPSPRAPGTAGLWTIELIADLPGAVDRPRAGRRAAAPERAAGASAAIRALDAARAPADAVLVRPARPRSPRAARGSLRADRRRPPSRRGRAPCRRLRGRSVGRRDRSADAREDPSLAAADLPGLLHVLAPLARVDRKLAGACRWRLDLPGAEPGADTHLTVRSGRIAALGAAPTARARRRRRRAPGGLGRGAVARRPVGDPRQRRQGAVRCDLQRPDRGAARVSGLPARVGLSPFGRDCSR